jgi:DNA-binding NarL/FixJ family response regulator
MQADTCFLCALPISRSTVIRMAGPIGGRQETISLHPACAVKFAQGVLAAFETGLTHDYETARRISDHAPLAKHEKRVLTGIVNGLSNAQIAEETGLALHTVKNYCYTIFEKLHVENRVQALLYALDHDLVESAR